MRSHEFGTEWALRLSAIPKGSGRHEDYEAAKAIAAVLARYPAEYEAMVKEAAKYVGV